MAVAGVCSLRRRSDRFALTHPPVGVIFRDVYVEIYTRTSDGRNSLEDGPLLLHCAACRMTRLPNASARVGDSPAKTELTPVINQVLHMNFLVGNRRFRRCRHDKTRQARVIRSRDNYL